MKRREMSLHHRKQASAMAAKRCSVRGPRSATAKLLGVELGGEVAAEPVAELSAPAAQPNAKGSDQALFKVPLKPVLKPVRAKSKRPAQSGSKGGLFKSKRCKKPSTRQGSGANNTPVERLRSLVRKAGAVTVAELDAGLPADDEYEKLDKRAIDAARWTDKSITRLISEIKERSTPNGSGQPTITFGKLFDETANIFDALVGILKAAKKYRCVHFDGDQLWQGRDDGVVITLTKEIHTGILINRRKLTNMKTGKMPAGGFGGGNKVGSKCHVCGKTVYQLEYVGANDKAFHKACFRCKVCNIALKAGDYCTVNDQFFCPTHYKEKIMAAGGAGKEHAAGTFD